MKANPNALKLLQML